MHRSPPTHLSHPPRGEDPGAAFHATPDTDPEAGSPENPSRETLSWDLWMRLTQVLDSLDGLPREERAAALDRFCRMDPNLARFAHARRAFQASTPDA